MNEWNVWNVSFSAWVLSEMLCDKFSRHVFFYISGSNLNWISWNLYFEESFKATRWTDDTKRIMVNRKWRNDIHLLFSSKPTVMILMNHSCLTIYLYFLLYFLLLHSVVSITYYLLITTEYFQFISLNIINFLQKSLRINDLK